MYLSLSVLETSQPGCNRIALARFNCADLTCVDAAVQEDAREQTSLGNLWSNQPLPRWENPGWKGPPWVTGATSLLWQPWHCGWPTSGATRIVSHKYLKSGVTHAYSIQFDLFIWSSVKSTGVEHSEVQGKPCLKTPCVHSAEGSRVSGVQLGQEFIFISS